jgi:cytochrome d ubiquinol oxidase subunit I
MGRQPWVVQGLLRTSDAVSPTVNATSVALSMGGFTLLYAVLAVIAIRVFARTAKAGPEPIPDAEEPRDGDPPGTPRNPSDLVLSY